MRTLSWLVLLIAWTGSTTVQLTAAEVSTWSTYRGSNARTSHLAVDLATDLQLLWQHLPSQPPQPAWPPPARGSYWQQLSKLSPRVVDDHTFHPICAGDAVLFASSANDTVTCLEIESGKIRWQLTTDGPVRYAPSVVDDRVYFGSDDGKIYCADLSNGQILWQRRLAPIDRMIPGNGRLISPWPVRTGVAVTDGVAYVGAGLFPSQGVYVFALDATDGNTVWRQKIDYTVHGYLLISQDRLILPTGRSTPIILHRSDGRFLAQLPGTPGTYAVVTRRELLSGHGNDGSLGASDIATHESLVSVPAQQICITPGHSYLLGGNRLEAVDLPKFLALSRQLKQQKILLEKQNQLLRQLRKSSTTEPQKIERSQGVRQQLTEEIDTLESQRQACRLWHLVTPHHGCLAVADNMLVLGGKGTIELRHRLDGHLVKQFSLPGEALGIALADQHLVVTTNTGKVYCFSSRRPGKPKAASSGEFFAATAENPWSQKIADLVTEHLHPSLGSTRGYALVVGAEDPALLEALYRQTEFTLVAIDSHPHLVESLRQHLHQRGLYGTRIAVHLVEPERLPFADYFANLVISARRLADKKDSRWPEEELLRLLRPGGGIAWLDLNQPHSQRPELAGAGRWNHQYGNTANTATSDDQLIRANLQLQWFGGPGPARMVDRHLRAPAPLAANGRMFIGGENSMVCIDSYHGTEYWQLDIPNSQRYSMPYDCGYATIYDDQFAIAVQDSAWLIDARNGAVKEKIPVPLVQKDHEVHWGYLAFNQAGLYGSTQQPAASRTLPSRDQIDRDYRNNRPLVTSTGLFLMDRFSKKLRWHHRAIILNPTITIAEDRVYFVASNNRSLENHANGRILLQDLLAKGAEIVALEASTGKIVWKKQLNRHMLACRNILYLQSSKGRLILSGSYHRDNDSWYRIAVLDSSSGNTIWVGAHQEGKPGAFTHGEQVHHPVILGDRLVCEPAIYQLETGRRIAPGGEAEAWILTRPGHSCGTMSGAGDCLFFRSGNPTVMDLTPGLAERDRFQKISPSRPGCWINIIPADGLVLIPEASASCVCHYSLQTSMAFQPVSDE